MAQTFDWLTPLMTLNIELATLGCFQLSDGSRRHPIKSPIQFYLNLYKASSTGQESMDGRIVFPKDVYLRFLRDLAQQQIKS